MKDVRQSIRAAEKAVNETRILQKVNAVHREAFREKYPGQIEHILRLLCERLHLGLDKRDGVDVTDVATWRLTSAEIADLAQAVHYIHNIRQSLNRDAGS
tara:strand:- start:625 stop:924 length:300 start_codon:yes stop_codon:yes gene_type:complete